MTAVSKTSQSFKKPQQSKLQSNNESAFIQTMKESSHLLGPGENNNQPSFNIKTQNKPTAIGYSTNPKYRQNTQFLQLSDQNKKLKIKQSRQQQLIRQLRQQNKDAHRPGITKKQAQELMQLRRQNKQLNRQLFQVKSGSRSSAQKRAVTTLQKQKISDLLKVIDKYKSQAFQAQEQLKRYQEGEQYKNNNNKSSAKKQKEVNFQNSQYLSQYAIKNSYYQSPSMNIEMNRLKEQNIFLQSEISRLNAQNSTKNLLQDQIFQLKSQNRKLQQKLRRLVQSPIFGGQVTHNRLEDQAKVQALQSKLKIYAQKIEKQKQKCIKLETQLAMTQRQLKDSNDIAQTSDNQNIKLRARIKDHPIIDVILRDEEMFNRVIGYLQTQNYRSQIIGSIDKNNPRYSKNDPNFKIQTLISENELLALELTRNQKMLRTLKDLYEQHQKVRQLQQKQFSQFLEQKDKRINQLSILAGQKNKIQVMKNGIKYQDEVNVFTDENYASYESGINFFDIYLAQLNLVDTFVRQQIKISDVSKIMSFATVDFYNHQTQNTKPGSGLRYSMNSQFSFKVVQDQTLFRYLQKGQITINIWTTDGGKSIILGQAKINLKPMTTNSKPSLAPVVNSSVPIYLNNRSVGSLNFVMRMRLPIYKQLSEIKSSIVNSFSAGNQPLHIGNYETKKLSVKIEGAQGLPMNVNSFVYYTLNNNDYYTQVFGGSNPQYDYMNVIPITYSPQFQHYLRRQDLEFTVLDDNAPVNDMDHSAMIGICKMPLSKLMFSGGIIDQRLNIINRNGQIKGILVIKVFWYETESNIQNNIAKGLINNFSNNFNNNNNDNNYNNTMNNFNTTGNLFNLTTSNIHQNMFDTIGSIGKKLFPNHEEGRGQFNNMYKSNNLQTPQKINNYIKQIAQNKDLTPSQLFSKFDDNNSNIITLGQLKQGLEFGLGIYLTNDALDRYYNSFKPPITIQSFFKALGINYSNNSSNMTQSYNKKISSSSNISNYSTEEINNHLRQYAQNHQLSMQQLFKLFDDNKTDIVTEKQVKQCLAKNFGIRLSERELSTYFYSFDQPLNFKNFQNGLRNLAQINKMVQKNTSFLKKMSMRQFIRQKDVKKMAKQIDKDGNNIITKKELVDYLQKNGVYTDDIMDQKINVINFLRKFSSKQELQKTSINIPMTGSLTYKDSPRR